MADDLVDMPGRARWPWRDVLTEEEREIVERAEAAKAEWLRLNDRRAGIINRAIQRAKYRARAASLKGAPENE